MSIVPDTKDWTWVLERACPECGFDTRTARREGVPGVIRGFGARWGGVLETSDDVRRRPSDTVWSPLEYGCHVRDVVRIMHERVLLMLREDDPLFQNWDQDATAVARRYAEDNPRAAARAVRTSADALAATFDGLTDAEWQRPGRRSDGAVFTVESLARYLLHDPIHHLHDVGAR